MPTLAPVPTGHTDPLDLAVRLVTAFDTWSAMRSCIVSSGYVPTLLNWENPACQMAVEQVRAACDREGLMWFDGRHTSNDRRPTLPLRVPSWRELDFRWAEIATEITRGELVLLGWW